MKSIKKKISIPFIILIIVIPLITLLLFNIAMNYYIRKSVREELKNTVDIMELLVKKQLAGNIGDEPLTKKSTAAINALSVLRASLRASSLSQNTEFLLVSKDYELIFPQELSDGFIDKQLAAKIMEILPNAQKGTIHEINTDEGRFLAMGYKLNSLAQAQSPYVVFLSNLNNTNGLVRLVNLFLIVILILCIGIGTFISLKISKSISKPLDRLCQYAGRIGAGEFVTLPDETSSLELHELYCDMNEMSKRLSNYDSAQKKFLQNASHELRTPLMSIQGYAEGICKGVLPNTEAAAQIICDESKRLSVLVDELLTLSRIETGTYKEEKKQTNLGNMVKEYIQRVNGIALKENKQILTLIPDVPVLAVIDEGLLAQAVANILSNCIRYAKTNVIVEVCSKKGNSVIRISDDGNGISEADLPHLFERFYKGQNGNFGLGLSIAKSAIELMGGKVEAYNTSRGATFEIELH